MPQNPLQFELSKPVSAEQFQTSLNKKIDIRLASQQTGSKTFYDSFDWRLFSGKISCEFNQTSTNKRLVLTQLNTDHELTSLVCSEMPIFSRDFPKGKIRKTISPLLEMRALLPIVTLEYSTLLFNILNKDEKTVIRLRLETNNSIHNRIVLLPVKGYDKAVERVAKILEQSINLKPADKPLIIHALKSEGRKPMDYSSKLKFRLDPAMRADIASKYIYKQLSSAVKINRDGTIKDIDSEFLHDFRVAVRRTRSGLSQIKNVLPRDEISEFTEFFAWLGQITGPTRDLDVYLLNFENYKKRLPVTIRQDLDPLYDFLQVKQKKAQKELAKKLNSEQYHNTLAKWDAYLKKSVPRKPPEANAVLPIKELSNKRIWRVYKKVLEQGYAIDNNSPAEALHELRKTCKKLRYLMEFFQSLYPDEKIKFLIKTLKGFQDVLGDFQDYEVQENAIKQFSEEMMKNNIAAVTFLAMGVLIQNLDKRRIAAREDFGNRFAEFSLPENQATFKALFSA